MLSFHEIHERRKPERGVMRVRGEVEHDAPNYSQCCRNRLKSTASWHSLPRDGTVWHFRLRKQDLPSVKPVFRQTESISPHKEEKY